MTYLLIVALVVLFAGMISEAFPAERKHTL